MVSRMGSPMKEKLHPLIIEQQKRVNESLKKDKEVWQDLYSVLGAYTKEFNELFKTGNKKISK